MVLNWLELIPVVIDLLGKFMGRGRSRPAGVDPAAHARVQEQLAAATRDVQNIQTQMKEQDERTQRLINEQSLRMDEQKKEFESNMSKQRQQFEQALHEAQQKEGDLMKALHMFSTGFSPIVWPTTEEIQRAERLLGLDAEDYYHIAVAGYTGTGKSSMINALRGVKNNDKQHAARVGVTETTTGIGRYPNPNTDGPRAKFIWYDIPGSGTLSKPGPQYFNEHGLFVFDMIIVLFGGRFSQQDLAILEHCARFKVPTFLVRSKSNQYIENIIREEFDYEGIHAGQEFELVYQQARDKYIRETRQSVWNNLTVANYHDPYQKVYHISAPGMRAFVNNVPEANLQPTSRWLDEEDLVSDIAKTIVRRRFDPSSSEAGETEVEAKIRDAMNLAHALFGGRSARAPTVST